MMPNARGGRWEGDPELTAFRSLWKPRRARSIDFR